MILGISAKVSKAMNWVINNFGIISFIINTAVYLLIICIITHYLAKLYIHSRKLFDRKLDAQKVHNRIGAVYTAEVIPAIIIELFRYQQGYSFVGAIVSLVTSVNGYMALGNMILYWLILRGIEAFKNNSYKKRYQGAPWLLFKTTVSNNFKIYHYSEVFIAFIIGMIGLEFNIGIINIFVALL